MCGLNIALCCRVKLEDMGFANLGLIKCKRLAPICFPCGIIWWVALEKMKKIQPASITQNTYHSSHFVFSYTTEEKIHWVRCPLITQEKSEQVFATSTNIKFAKHCLIFLFVYFYPWLSGRNLIRWYLAML